MIKSWEDFILETYKRKSRGEVVEGTEDQIEEILSKYVPWYDPMSIKMPLYRSVMTGTTLRPYYPYKIMDPKKFVRKPPTTENYYNVIVDNSEAWVEYPKRSRSIMTHTKENKTRLYGNKVYRVIPLKENTKCAYVNNDYWMTFNELFKSWPFGRIESLNEFNQSLRNLFNLPKKDYSADKLKELLSSKNLNIENLSYDDQSLVNKWRRILSEIESEHGSLYNWIEKKMSPEFTEVHLFNYNSNTHIGSLPIGYEVWTDERCLLVDEDILRKLYVKKKNPVNEEVSFRKILLGLATFLSVGLSKMDAKSIESDQHKLAFVKDISDWNEMHVDGDTTKSKVPKDNKELKIFLVKRGWNPDTVVDNLLIRKNDGTNNFIIDNSIINIDPDDFEFDGQFCIHPNVKLNLGVNPSGLSNIGGQLELHPKFKLNFGIKPREKETNFGIVYILGF